jgi:hypothetical protein
LNAVDDSLADRARHRFAAVGLHLLGGFERGRAGFVNLMDDAGDLSQPRSKGRRQTVPAGNHVIDRTVAPDEQRLDDPVVAHRTNQRLEILRFGRGPRRQLVNRDHPDRKARRRGAEVIDVVPLRPHAVVRRQSLALRWPGWQV